MKAILGLIILVLTLNHAFAGGEVGNGGNVVVCADSSGRVKSVELLDYYELRLNGGLLSLNPKLETYQEKLIDLFNKWREVAPKRMDQYTLWLNEFQAEAGIYSGIEIPHIPDTGSIAIPQGCKSISIAFQREDGEIFPGTKRYVINKDLWDYMDETQKAGLVLHELIYREAIKAAHTTSLPTRYFNGYLSSATPKTEEYAYIVSKLPLLWVEYAGIILQIGSLSTDCGLGGNCSPYFERYTSLSEDGKVVDGHVSGVYADFNLNGWHIKFKKDINEQRGKFKFNSITGNIYSYGLGFYEVGLENKFYFRLKDERVSDKLSFGKNEPIRFSVGHSASFENSWFVNDDETIIRDINSVYHNSDMLKTSDGSTWSWNSKKNMYIQDQYFIKLKTEQIECVPKERNSIYHYFECAKIPSKINCNVGVWNPGKDNGYIKENVTIASSRILIKADSAGTYSIYEVLLPKGQIISYEKKRGKLKALKLSSDTYFKIENMENGECRLSY